jgi:phosphoenolpyruvate phosphomutase
MADELVYVGMVGDMLHAGHINVLNKARSLGRVVVGILTDEAVAGYKRLPFLNYEERASVVMNVSGIERVVPQTTLSYRENLLELRPRYVVHGDDWRYGDKVIAARQEVIQLLSSWGGELVEVPYTLGVSSTLINQALFEDGIMLQARQGRFRRLLETKPLVRVIEAHNALAAMVASHARSEDRTFDAVWQSSFTDATARGKPDAEIVDPMQRIATVNEIFDATHLPLVYDGDTGGSSERVFHLARSLERTGVSALCLEDKIGSKRNSLYGKLAHKPQQQASIAEFAGRLKSAKCAVGCGKLMIIARIESLVLGGGLNDAIERSEAYLDAGADAILIHSISKTASEVVSFASRLHKLGSNAPIIVVPTTYGTTHEQELIDGGIRGVIYANQLLRAAYPAMVRTANHILRAGCAEDSELTPYLASAKELLDLIPEEWPA